jgi:hypothetical protein
MNSVSTALLVAAALSSACPAVWGQIDSGTGKIPTAPGPPPHGVPPPPPGAPPLPGPPPKPGPPADPRGAIQKLDATRFKLGELEFDQSTREVRIPCKVNMRDEGLLEYVLVHSTGKVHESLLSTTVKPFELNVVLLLLNWKKSDAFFDFSKPERGGVAVKNAVNPKGSKTDVFLEYKDAAGALKTCRVESWLRNLAEKNITKGPFIYTGSQFLPDGSFLAEQTGSILSLYLDPVCLLNNPRQGNDDDNIWTIDPVVPAKGTPVTLIFKPVADPDGNVPDPSAPGSTEKENPEAAAPSAGESKRPLKPVPPENSAP